MGELLLCNTTSGENLFKIRLEYGTVENTFLCDVQSKLIKDPSSVKDNVLFQQYKLKKIRLREGDKVLEALKCSA